MPGWDDIEVFASDAAAVMVHPIQMVMAADEVIDISWIPGRFVSCKHPRRLGYHIEYNPTFVNDKEVIELRVYMISFPVTFDTRANALRMRVYWAMGLCACGKLYWKPLTDEAYVE